MKLPRILALAAALALAGCGEGETTAKVAVRNAFSKAQFTLVEVAFRDARWTEPVGLNAVSADVEIAPGRDYAYALAVWAYDPAANPPQQPLVLRTKEKIEAIAGARVELVFSEPSHQGKCGGLSAEEYDRIARTWFSSASVEPYDSILCGP